MIEVERVDYIVGADERPTEGGGLLRDVLGLPESEYSESGIEETERDVAISAPGADGEPFPPNTAGIALRVPDVEARARSSRRRASRWSATSWTRACATWRVFTDPDGNVFMLHRRYAPTVKRG